MKSFREQLRDKWREDVITHPTCRYDENTLEDILEDSVSFLSERECKEYLQGGDS